MVIPCYNEPHLNASLDALRNAMPPLAAVEVIVVINEPEGASEEIHQRNLRTLLDAEAWKRDWDRPDWMVHLIYVPNLPPKHAGVGLARKIGMDEAYARFYGLSRLETGIIVCFDADSQCDDDYLTAIEHHFQRYATTPACSIHYEHPLKGPDDPALYSGIVGYELHLRYYVDALRWAGYPYAYQTIGSSMAVRARDYGRVQGMNRRKAGEDFYFLHKLIPLGEFTELTTTRVIPSPRLSDRVPFGTGKAMHDWLASSQQDYPTYHPGTFEALRPFLTLLLDEHTTRKTWNQAWVTLDPTLRQWLDAEGFLTAWEEAKEQSRQHSTYITRVLRWLDGLRMLKYVHFARDQTYGAVSVAKAATWLLEKWGVSAQNLSLREQLSLMRHRDRQTWRHPQYPHSQPHGGTQH